MLGEWYFLDAIFIFIANYIILIEDLSTNFRRSLKMYNNNLFIVYLILTIISEGAVSYFCVLRRTFILLSRRSRKPCLGEPKSRFIWQLVLSQVLISILFQIFIERISLRLLLLKSSKSRTSDKRSVYVLKNKCWTTATHPLLVSVDIQWHLYDDCRDCDLYINKFFLIQNNTQYFKNHMVMVFSGVLWINIFFGLGL